MPNYTMRADGTAANKAAALGGDPAQVSQCMNVTVASGETFSPDDFVLPADTGGVYRDTLYLASNGSSGNPITYKNYPGHSPKVSGADLITGWSVDSGDRYQATLATTPYHVLVDGVLGTGKASAGACTSNGDFYYDGGGNTLYLYDDTQDPDDYSSPGIEATVRDTVVEFATDQDYVTLDGIHVSGGNYASIRAVNPGNYCVIQNCLVEYAGEHGIGVGDDTQTSTGTGWIIQDNECRYNMVTGITAMYRVTEMDIRRNNVHNNATLTWPGDDYTGNIKLFDNTDYLDNVRIYENYVHDTGRGLVDDYKGRGVGIWTDATKPPTGTVDIYHNWVQDCDGDGIFIEISDDTRVWGNVVVDCGTCDPGWGQDHLPAGIDIDIRETFDSENNLIYNNIVIGGQVALSCAGYDLGSGRMNNNIWRNNVCYGYSDHALVCDEAGANDTYGSGNVYNNNAFGTESSNFIWWKSGYSTYDAWLAASSQTDNNTEDDLSSAFTNPGADDYTCAPGSPLIGAGVDLGSPFNTGLMPASLKAQFPSNVVTGDRGDY